MILREAAILGAALFSGGRMVHIEGGRMGGSEAVIDQLLGTQGGKDGVISILPYLYISWKKMRHYLFQSWTLSACLSCGDGAFVVSGSQKIVICFIQAESADVSCCRMENSFRRVPII